MTLDTSNIQHEKLVIKLVEPHIPGFSVSPAKKSESLEGQSTESKPVEAKKRSIEVEEKKKNKKNKK